ncbi:hypothetical protein PHBOTO_003900 [Pseudozyma hubeiensis]|nr:hypothetical protein PHBOTO_003900 [Pseudozyma hubeiensis]
MVKLNKIAFVAALSAAHYAAASPVEGREALEARTLGEIFKLFDLNPADWSCIAPWKHASLPSFSLGCIAPGIPQWDGGDKTKCKYFWNWWTPFCREGNKPKPPPGSDSGSGSGGGVTCSGKYEQTYKNYQTVADSGVYEGKTVGAATIDSENYITYILTDSLDKCLKACDETSGCVFVNLYQDNAENPSDVDELPPSAQPKYKKGNLTCALYKACSGTDKATNYGGQQDPTFITDSSAYCKSGKC